MRIQGLVLAFVTAGGIGWAQQWEFGAVGGAAFLSSAPVTSTIGSATAGLQNGPAIGAFFGQNLTRRFSGEVRYMFVPSGLSIQSNGSTATFSGQEHVLTYDFIVRFNHPGSRTEFFVAAGGGMKIFRGTGQEQAYQPLSQYGYFTNTQVIKPTASIGAGMKYAITPKLLLRTEVRDYISPFPSEVIAPAPGASYGSILQDIVPMVSLSYVF